MIMEKQPLIKSGWLRVLLFVISFLIIILLLSFGAENLISLLDIRQKSAEGGELSGNPASGNIMLIRFLVSFISSLLTVSLFRRFIDRRSIISLGFEWKGHQQHGGTGFFLAILLLCTGTSVLVASGNLQWIDVGFEANQLFIGFVLMILTAIAEELVFRAYVLNNLLQSMNKWMALLTSAAIFALFHQGNPGITPVASINVFIAGLLMGINYIYTRNLWYGIMFHFGWNFFEGSVLGYKVSGLNLKSLFEHELTGNELLTGGDFGFEGSLVNGVLMLIALMLMAWIYQRKFSNAYS